HRTPMKSENPTSYEEAAELLRRAADDGRPARFRGGGTKLGWGRPVPEPDLEIATGGLDRVLEHNAGDFTAVLQAGVPLAVAQDGGKVIKNVAGYDLGKLFAGAYGTLGLIAEVTVRLHPRPARTATVVARSSDPAQLAAAAAALAHAPLEADCLDLWWNATP